MNSIRSADKVLPNFSKDTVQKNMTKEGFKMIFNDEFNDAILNSKNWFEFYLPQWSSRLASAPQYSIKDGNLVLNITQDQKAWCIEFNGEVKVSSLQTGVYAGAVGTGYGQHQFAPNLKVRECQPVDRKFVPQYGYFEIRAKAIKSCSNIVSLWMIGFEDSPDKSAEICVFEVKGAGVKSNKAIIGYGLHKFNDPRLKEEFYEESFNIDATEYHIYAVDWTRQYIDFFLDGILVKRINQSPCYPMQLMLGIYEVPVKKGNADDKIYPKNFVVDYIRAYKRDETK